MDVICYFDAQYICNDVISRWKPFSSKRSTHCFELSLSGTSQSSNRAGIMNKSPSGLSSAASRASFISFWMNPVFETDLVLVFRQTNVA